MHNNTAVRKPSRDWGTDSVEMMSQITPGSANYPWRQYKRYEQKYLDTVSTHRPPRSLVFNTELLGGRPNTFGNSRQFIFAYAYTIVLSLTCSHTHTRLCTWVYRGHTCIQTHQSKSQTLATSRRKHRHMSITVRVAGTRHSVEPVVMVTTPESLGKGLIF